MIKHIWSILSKESKIEAETNNVSIIDAYESLQFNVDTHGRTHDPSKPLIAPFNFEVMTLFYRDTKGAEETHTEHVVLLDPRGKELARFKADFTFGKEHNRMRNRVRYTSLPLTSSGTYVFQIFLEETDKKKEKMVGSIPLDVDLKVDGEQL